jgi:methylamine dehydrogenase accessory protein MauD
MDVALLLARLLLAVVFAVAGVAKLADRAGSGRAVAEFGVPTPLATPLGVLLPLAELAVAAALIPTSTAWWGAVGAFMLLLLFVVGIGANLARGRKPDCHCFGQLHSEPAGWKTLARNGVLAALAGFVVWRGYGGAGPSAVGWLTNLSTAQAAGLVVGLAVLGAVAAQWWLLLHLLRQNGRLLLRVQALEWGAPSSGGVADRPAAGLPIGEVAPDFELPGLNGGMLTVGSLRAAEKPAMLLFTDPDCGPCTAMLPDIRRWQKAHAEDLTIALVSRGTVEENRAKATEHGLRGIFLQKDWEVSEAYGVDSTPSAVLVLSGGTIGSPVLEGEEGVKALLAYAMGERGRMPTYPGSRQGELHPAPGDGGAAPAEPEGPRVGEPAPQIELPDLGGETVALADFRGEKTLVLLWDPGCGFCREMLPDLKEWEANPPEGAPNLFVVSAGTVEANKEMGLSSPVVLDGEQFPAGRAFGADGTPSAVLVDERGRIASELAVGLQAVLELVRAPQEARV